MFKTLNKEKGQGLVEYALIASLVSLVVIGALMAFSPEIRSTASLLFTSVSGGFTVEDGNLSIPGISPTQTFGSSTLPASSPSHAPASFTPTASRTPTFSPTPTLSPTPTSLSTLTPSWTATPTWTPIVVVTATPNALACTPGNAYVSKISKCSALSASNNCTNYTFTRWSGKCTWY
jgi:Flp pilus assembly pilin Flp